MTRKEKRLRRRINEFLRKCSITEPGALYVQHPKYGWVYNPVHKVYWEKE